MSSKPRLLILLACLFIGVTIFLIYFLKKPPLVCYGFTEYYGERKQIDIELVNKGLSDIYLKGVKINNGEKPLKAQLAISYTSQLVAGGIDEDTLAKFLNINEAPIHPDLKLEEKQEAFKTKTIPINYGIRLNNGIDINSVTIKYKYLGITFTKRINLDTFPN